MGVARNIARQQKKLTRGAPLAKAAELLNKLEGMKELAEVLKPIGEDLREARLALAMVIQDQGEADRKFERFRKALILALRQDMGLTNIEESLDHYEATLAKAETETKVEEEPCPTPTAE